MMKQVLITVLWVTLFGISSNAQVFVQNTLYPFSRLVYNPATAGMSGGTQLTLLGRLQWLGIDGAPTLFTTSLDTRLESIQSGVGGYIIGDKLGPLSTTGINGSYSYHLPIVEDKLVLGIGASAGILQKAINGEFRYDPGNGEDPVVPLGQYSNSVIVPNLAAGLYLRGLDEEGKEQFYVGISGTDLLEPSIDDLTLNPGVGQDSRVSRTFYLTAGYRFVLSEHIELEPSLLARTDGASSQFDLSAFLTLKSLVLVGLSHRFGNDSFSGSLGVKINDNAFVAYAYDYTISGLNQNGDISSHELVLSYTFPKAGKRARRIDQTKD
ncbi:MAG: type IX secretion system membrane protein PorP/SprF [Bacteroidetes bacterium]|nr:MAG: type IX secretion system membrane protein PorP/SprF [Bacteroidota bacterium]